MGYKPPYLLTFVDQQWSWLELVEMLCRALRHLLRRRSGALRPEAAGGAAQPPIGLPNEFK